MASALRGALAFQGIGQGVQNLVAILLQRKMQEEERAREEEATQGLLQLIASFQPETKEVPGASQVNQMISRTSGLFGMPAPVQVPSQVQVEPTDEAIRTAIGKTKLTSREIPALVQLLEGRREARTRKEEISLRGKERKEDIDLKRELARLGETGEFQRALLREQGEGGRAAAKFETERKEKAGKGAGIGLALGVEVQPKQILEAGDPDAVLAYFETALGLKKAERAGKADEVPYTADQISQSIPFINETLLASGRKPMTVDTFLKMPRTLQDTLFQSTASASNLALPVKRQTELLRMRFRAGLERIKSVQKSASEQAQTQVGAARKLLEELLTATDPDFGTLAYSPEEVTALYNARMEPIRKAAEALPKASVDSREITNLYTSLDQMIEGAFGPGAEKTRFPRIMALPRPIAKRGISQDQWDEFVQLGLKRGKSLPDIVGEAASFFRLGEDELTEIMLNMAAVGQKP